MADVYFKCACGKSLAVDERGVGLTVLCVDCGQPVKVPEAELEFACEGCQAVLLAPLAIAGDRIKCTRCGHRMMVPGHKVEEEIPVAKRCMDTLMARNPGQRRAGAPQVRKHSEILARHGSGPEPYGSGRHQPASGLFRLAILGLALVATGELFYLAIRERPLGSMPKEPGTEALTPGAADMASTRQAATESPVPKVAKTLVASVQKPEMIPEIVGTMEVTGKFVALRAPLIPPPAGESVVVARESSRITSAPPAPAEEKEAKYAALRVMHLKQDPALQELVAESQKLNTLINYKTGWKQSQTFSDLLKKSLEQLNAYTQTHSGKDLDDFYWSTSYFIIYGHAIRTARSYEEAERILREGWALLEEAESGNPRAVPRTLLSLGVNLTQDWVKENPLECARLLDELEGMAWEAGMDKVGDIWRPNASGLQVRFMKYAGNVPEEKRAAFFHRHKQRLERYLMDDSIRRRNRAATLRGWIVLLDKAGSLTDALPVIQEWPKRYGEKTLEMNYYFARLWVEVFGEGDLEKATKTVRLATRAAQSQKDGKLFDEKNYVKLIQLYYDSLGCPGYEIKRQRTMARNKIGDEALKTAFYKGKAK